MNEPATAQDQIRRLQFYNASGEDIPPFAVMKLLSYDPESDVFSVDQPTKDGYPYGLAFNGRVTVPAGDYGFGSTDLPNWARYFTEDGSGSGSGSGDADCPPRVQQLWGPKAGSWDLHPDEGGFRVLSVDTEDRRAIMVVMDPYGVNDGSNCDDDGSGSGSGSGSGGAVECSGVKTTDIVHCKGGLMEDRCLDIVAGRLVVKDSLGNVVATS